MFLAANVMRLIWYMRVFAWWKKLHVQEILAEEITPELLAENKAWVLLKEKVHRLWETARCPKQHSNWSFPISAKCSSLYYKIDGMCIDPRLYRALKQEENPLVHSQDWNELQLKRSVNVTLSFYFLRFISSHHVAGKVYWWGSWTSHCQCTYGTLPCILPYTVNGNVGVEAIKPIVSNTRIKTGAI